MHVVTVQNQRKTFQMAYPNTLPRTFDLSGSIPYVDRGICNNLYYLRMFGTFYPGVFIGFQEDVSFRRGYEKVRSFLRMEQSGATSNLIPRGGSSFTIRFTTASETVS